MQDAFCGATGGSYRSRVFVCGNVGLASGNSIRLNATHPIPWCSWIDRTSRTDLVRPAISEDVNHQLSSLQEQILSRTRLEAVIEKFGLYAKDRGRVPIAELAEHPEKGGERETDGIDARDADPVAEL